MYLINHLLFFQNNVTRQKAITTYICPYDVLLSHESVEQFSALYVVTSDAVGQVDVDDVFTQVEVVVPTADAPEVEVESNILLVD